MEVAVTPWSVKDTWDAETLCEQAARAEEIGFHSFWLPENHFGSEKSIPSPLTLLAAVASRTSKIKLGTTSYLLTIRHPLQAAAEVAVLDQLSKGRVILGVGRGVQDAMFKAFDVDKKNKRKLFQANLEIMRNAWQGLPVSGSETDAIILDPLPFQKPYPPIWVAAFGPLALKQAGTLGLPYLASPIESLDTLKENYLQHQEAMQLANRKAVKCIPVMRTVFISEDNSLLGKVKLALENSPGHQMRDKDCQLDEWAIVGNSSFVKERLQEYKESLGITHLIARGRIPEVSTEEQIESHQNLILIAKEE